MKYYQYLGGLAQVPDVKHDVSIRFILAGALELSWADYLAKARGKEIMEKDPDGRRYVHRKYWHKLPVDNFVAE